MRKLIEYTKILRSKNAGPLFVTFDLIFASSRYMLLCYLDWKIFSEAKIYPPPERQ